MPLIKHAAVNVSTVLHYLGETGESCGVIIHSVICWHNIPRHFFNVYIGTTVKYIYKHIGMILSVNDGAL